MKKAESGLTITEVLVALGIVGVMTSITIPPMNDFMESSRVRGDSQDLLSSLLLARSESVVRNSMVSLCKIDQAAPETCDNSSDWQSGWIAFEDEDTDGVRDVGEAIFDTYSGMGDSTVVTATNYTNSVSFLPSGGITSNGDFKICVNGNIANSIVINATGRPRIMESVC